MDPEFDKAYEAALAMLRMTDRFESEIRRRLGAYSTETVDAVIGRLRDRGILNDQRSATRYFEDRTGRHALGSTRIAGQLERRGAPQEVIDSVVQQVDDTKVAMSLLRSERGLTPADRGRAGRMLIRKGVDPDLVDSCLDRYFEGELS